MKGRHGPSGRSEQLLHSHTVQVLVTVQTLFFVQLSFTAPVSCQAFSIPSHVSLCIFD
jgi:hypothetical protein